MRTTVPTTSAVSAQAGAECPSRLLTARPIRVFMMDLLSIVPYYTGHLCASLTQVERINVTLGSITYRHDRGFFGRKGLRNIPGLLDLVSRFRIAPAARRALKLLESLINMAALLLRFSVSRPDVIHVQFIPLVKYGLPFEIWFLKLASSLGIKLVYTVHNVLPQDTGDRHRTTFRRIYHLADRLICHDLPARDRLVADFGVEPNRISVIPHGPLFENGSRATPEQARVKLGFTGNESLVLWQGILRPYKGVPFLLYAWRRVCSEGLRARLVIVGSGENKLAKAIEEQVCALGIGCSTQLELRFVSVEELADLYQAADILVYPYREISTSGSLMTGIAYGKAIVATALPAFEQVLRHGENALLVRYGDTDALAASLIRLISDPELRRRLGERLRESFSRGPAWSSIARQTHYCYRAVLSARPAPK